jgi:hypothetical protein
MNTDNVWLQQKSRREHSDVLHRAAKKIAKSFFPKPARKDIYYTCLSLAPNIMAKYDKDAHGPVWPWVFLNMLSVVDAKMCAAMIIVVCESEIPWQQRLAKQCLLGRSKEFLQASQPTTSETAATSMHRKYR